MILRATMIASIVLATLPVGADDRSAHHLVQRWQQALRDTPRMSVEFRVTGINVVFDQEEHGVGAYYRSADCWAMHVMPATETPVSAMEPVNGRLREPKVLKPLKPYSVISTPNSLSYGDRISFDLHSWLPVSPEEAENVATPGTVGRFLRPFGRRFLAAITENAMPLVFVNSGDRRTYDVTLSRKATGDVWLEFTRSSHWDRGSLFQRVDAVFRPDESLPYAIRTIDVSGSHEGRVYIDKIQRGEDAQIPDDAFTPSGTPIRPPRTTHH